MILKATKRAFTQKEITNVTSTKTTKYHIDHSMDKQPQVINMMKSTPGNKIL